MYTYVRALRKSKEQTQLKVSGDEAKAKARGKKNISAIFRDDALMVYPVAQTRNIMREEIAISVKTLFGRVRSRSKATWRRGVET